MEGMMESMPGRMGGGWGAVLGLSLSGLDGGEGWPGCSLEDRRTLSTLPLSALAMEAAPRSSISERDFLFFRLTFLFLVDPDGAGRFLLLSACPWSEVLRRWSITSISSRMLEVGSWMTVHWGTVTGFSLTD